MLVILQPFVFDLWAIGGGGASTKCQWVGRDVITIDCSAKAASVAVKRPKLTNNWFSA